MTCEVTFKIAKREGYNYTPEQKALCKALKRKGVSIIILDFDEEQRLEANLNKYQYTVFTKEETKTGGAKTYNKTLKLALKEGLKLV